MATISSDGRHLVFPCPSCYEEVKAPMDAAGTEAECPHCGTALRVPGRAAHEKLPAQPLYDPITKAQMESLLSAFARGVDGHAQALRNCAEKTAKSITEIRNLIAALMILGFIYACLLLALSEM